MTDWAGYLQHFTEEGFSEQGISNLVGENPDSDSILLVQQTIHDAKKLISTLDAAPKSLHDAATGMKKRLLQHPSELEEIRARFNAMVVATAPWIATADKMKEQWSMEGRSIELAAWLRRLSSIDHNSPKETMAIIQAIENIAPRDQVRKAIESLESKQREREDILRDMTNILERKGWKIQFTENASLSQKFEEASQWLELEDRIDILEKNILLFEKRRPKSANIGLEIIENSRINGDFDAIKKLELAVKDELIDIQESNKEIHQRLKFWSTKGLIIFDSNELTHEQLWELEENQEELENQWALTEKNTNILRELLNDTNLKYPDWFGRVDSHEKMLDKIDEVSELQELLKNEIRNEIEKWENSGLSLEFFNTLTLERNIWEVNQEINKFKSLAEMAISMLDSIECLDYSLNNYRINEMRESIIQDWHIHSTLQFEMEEIDKISRRQNRHLIMLHQRAENISMDISESDDWTLAEFEDRLFDVEINRSREIEKQAKRAREKIDEKSIPEEEIEISINVEKAEEIEEEEEENWIEKKAADGKPFFYNERTKESTWKIPEFYTQRKETNENNKEEKNGVKLIENNEDSFEEILDLELNEYDNDEFEEIKEESDLTEIKNVQTPLRKRLGMKNKDPLSVESSRPRDLRIQRLLRLMPLIESKFDIDEQMNLVKELEPLLDNIEKWVRVRSEHRRCWDDSGGIIQKIDRLQEVLDKVPGPGIQLPIGFDKKPLPSTTDDLVAEIKDFTRNALVSTSGGIIAL